MVVLHAIRKKDKKQILPPAIDRGLWAYFYRTKIKRGNPDMIQAIMDGEHSNLRDSQRAQYRTGRHPNAFMVEEHSKMRDSPRAQYIIGRHPKRGWRDVMGGDHKKTRNDPSIIQAIMEGKRSNISTYTL